MNKYDEIFNEKLGELMKGVIYPESNILGNEFGHGFSDLVVKAISQKTEIDLQCSIDEYERVYDIFKKGEPYNCSMPAMFIALEAIMSLSPIELFKDHQVDMYIACKRSFIEMKRTWDTIAAPHIKEAQEYAKKVAERDQREAAVKANIKGSKGKIITLS